MGTGKEERDEETKMKRRKPRCLEPDRSPCRRHKHQSIITTVIFRQLLRPQAITHGVTKSPLPFKADVSAPISRIQICKACTPLLREPSLLPSVPSPRHINHDVAASPQTPPRLAVDQNPVYAAALPPTSLLKFQAASSKHRSAPPTRLACIKPPQFLSLRRYRYCLARTSAAAPPVNACYASLLWRMKQRRRRKREDGSEIGKKKEN